MDLNVLVLMGSPRRDGNTATLTAPFVKRLRSREVNVETVYLYDKNISPCISCYNCQEIHGEYGCILRDYMYDIVEEIMRADCIILASPIYSGYCTAPMKAMIDRHYGLNKHYGKPGQSSLWEGKKCGIIATCKYDLESNISPFENGVKKLCEHSKLKYIGKIGVKAPYVDDQKYFQSEKCIKLASDFADLVISNTSNY